MVPLLSLRPPSPSPSPSPSLNRHDALAAFNGALAVAYAGLALPGLFALFLEDPPEGQLSE